MSPLQQFLAGGDWGSLPLVSLVIFVLVFTAVVAHCCVGRRARQRAERLAWLPFEGEDEVATRGEERT